MGSCVQIQHCSKFSNKDYNFQRKTILVPKKQSHFKCWGETENGKINLNGNQKRVLLVCHGFLFPADDYWARNVDSPVIASQLSALALLPYMGFLYFITKSKSAPRLTLFGFYFLLAFVAAAIPAGIYAKVHCVTSLSNVDWLHGGVESLLMVTNLFVVMGLRRALRKAEDDELESPLGTVSELKEDE